MFVMKTVDELYDLVGYTLLSAPDNFPIEDYLDDDEQMDIDKAFILLRQGIEIAYPEDEWAEKKNSLYTLLEQSYTAYKLGDDVKGAHLLQDFQDSIFKL